MFDVHNFSANNLPPIFFLFCFPLFLNLFPFNVRCWTFDVGRSFFHLPVIKSPITLCSLLSDSPGLPVFHFLNPKSAIPNPKSKNPSFFSTFWRFYSRSRKYRINLLPKNTLILIFNNFGDMRAFLKTTGNRKGTINNDRQFKRKAYQALDAGNLSH